MRSSRVVSAVVAVVMVSGCALGIQGPDPERARGEVPRCDTGKGGVVLDGTMATLLGIASLAAFAGGGEGAGLALGATGGLFLGSAVRGNNAANDCQAAFADYTALRGERRRLVDEEPHRGPAPKPVAVPPVVEPAPAEPAPEVSPTYATPRPTPARTRPAPPKELDEDDWSAFWKEAP